MVPHVPDAIKIVMSCKVMLAMDRFKTSGGKQSKALPERIAGRNCTCDVLQIVEEKYRNIFENIQDVYYEIAMDGRILEVSPSCRQISHYERSELIGSSMYDIYADVEKRDDFLKRILKKGRVNDYEVLLKDKDGTFIPCAISAKVVRFKKGVSPRIIGIMRDISERKGVEEDLRHNRDELERRVRERTEDLEKTNTALRGEIEERRQIEKILKQRERELKGKSLRLEETNAALKVLLRHREVDRTEHEETILMNVRELVHPYIEKVKKLRLTETQAAYIHIIETNLNQIVSPFLRNLTSKHLNLTPREIQIADLIKEGKTTKEIADFLSVSIKTIDYHRDNIRDKLGLKRRKANLRSYLLSII
jgi:PAS domain S-box-containing protein